MEDILDLDTPHILERRLQTMVKTKGLARTSKQARQCITHRHIAINKKRITIPSYIVKRDEEGKIGFDNRSAFVDAEHPERVAGKKEEKKEGVEVTTEISKKPEQKKVEESKKNEVIVPAQ